MKRLALLTVLLMGPSFANAQSTEERFQDIFITAGYATAFGAALGAASLSFFDNPEQHLQYVAIGASLGFIGGSVLGSYVVFSPLIAENPPSQSSLLASGQVPARGIAVRPVFNPSSGRVTAYSGAWTFANF